jgi:PAS domain S-box-containing protein
MSQTTLTEGEELFRALVEQAADAFFLHDADARIIDVNRRACESLGYTREELLRLSVKDFDPAFDFAGLDAWERMVPGQPETVERVHVRKDGSTFPVEVRLGVVEVAGRRLFLALVRDMTEHKRVQATLERRAMLLRSIAEVAHKASSALDPSELMQQVVELIRERFGLYYVGLFLVEREPTLHTRPGEWAYLQAATGEAGQKMLRQGYGLKVGGNSMVGQCIARGTPCIAPHADEEKVRFANPLLPETRSELALPLISHGQVIGALTLQSSVENAFSEEDIAVLEIMAGQIANSLENARLYKQTRAALEELEAIHRSYLRQAWGRYLGEYPTMDNESEA